MGRVILVFPLAAGLFAAWLGGCSQSPGFSFTGRDTYRDEVARDVSAILEGMAAAHREQRLTLDLPRGRALPPDSDD